MRRRHLSARSPWSWFDVAFAGARETEQHFKDRAWRWACPGGGRRRGLMWMSSHMRCWKCSRMACQNKGGSVIDWVMQRRGVSFRHAMVLLKAEHPSLNTKLDHVVRKKTAATVKLEAPFEMSADDQEVLGQVVDYYHRTLKQSSEALRVSPKPRLDASGDHRSLQAGLCQPHIGLSIAGQCHRVKRAHPRVPLRPVESAIHQARRRQLRTDLREKPSHCRGNPVRIEPSFDAQGFLNLLMRSLNDPYPMASGRFFYRLGKRSYQRVAPQSGILQSR